jgi:ABC-type branched-subunit amino acid transport system ATPase component
LRLRKGDLASGGDLEDVIKECAAGLLAVDRVDLRIRLGEKTAVIRPSGAGTTTLFRLLNLTIPLSSGRLRFHGQVVYRSTVLRCRIL